MERCIQFDSLEYRIRYQCSYAYVERVHNGKYESVVPLDNRQHFLKFKYLKIHIDVAQVVLCVLCEVRNTIKCGRL